MRAKGDSSMGKELNPKDHGLYDSVYTKWAQKGKSTERGKCPG